MITREQRDKLGRYECGRGFVTFSLRDDDLIEYSWGATGFGVSASYTLSIPQLDSKVKTILTFGYEKTDEVPVAEVTIGGDDLLDWVGGITR